MFFRDLVLANALHMFFRDLVLANALHMFFRDLVLANALHMFFRDLVLANALHMFFRDLVLANALHMFFRDLVFFYLEDSKRIFRFWFQSKPIFGRRSQRWGHVIFNYWPFSHSLLYYNFSTPPPIL